MKEVKENQKISLNDLKKMGCKIFSKPPGYSNIITLLNKKGERVLFNQEKEIVIEVCEWKKK